MSESTSQYYRPYRKNAPTPGWALGEDELFYATELARQLGYVGDDLSETSVIGVADLCRRRVDATFTTGTGFLNHTVRAFGLPGSGSPTRIQFYDQNQQPTGLLELDAPKRVWLGYVRHMVKRGWKPRTFPPDQLQQAA